MIAIIGRIASGKSYLLNQMKKLGYKTFSCDEFVGQLYEKSSFFADQISLEISSNLVVNGFVSKDKVKQWLLEENSNIFKLEDIIYPIIFTHLETHTYDFVEIPILLTKKWDFTSFFDITINVVISEEKRQKNLSIRNVDKYQRDFLNQKNKEISKENELFGKINIVNISYDNIETICENMEFISLIKQYL
ncbi:dephospho-CoA kinase [Mycoplasma crocodyli]|uniref:Dephospho-CoA kinase n=1 Tax=Mycoplasma crocodyli (strain ATCC 51981 / MP145) TaxID=512564 RepID=D5E5Y2_MYCCM|nr:dephospho-CoA kinase [Mycoplasma crocodyli]ADE19547.1 dephospho-CoA kinase [Mycoplasma crocodyli MP145]